MSFYVTKRPQLDTSALQLSIRECLIALFVIAAFSTILTAGRAYNSNGMGIWLRSTMWCTICALIVIQSVGLQRLLTIKLPAKPYRSALSVCVALLATIVLVSVEVELLKYTRLVPKAHDPFLAFALFMTPPVLVIGGAVLMLIEFRGNFQQQTNTEDELSSDNLIKNSDGVWPEGKINTVHAQEHYRLIKGEFNERLVRARMIDAENRLKDEPGLRIHRSWWVARSRIQKITRIGRDYVLTTVDGQTIPVGRSRVETLKKASWII